MLGPDKKERVLLLQPQPSPPCSVMKRGGEMVLAYLIYSILLNPFDLFLSLPSFLTLTLIINRLLNQGV
jgi:hypothetical protein